MPEVAGRCAASWRSDGGIGNATQTGKAGARSWWEDDVTGPAGNDEAGKTGGD